ncbi:MAG: hypothetical protein ACLUSP_04895 [Christensenellales bacterium]
MDYRYILWNERLYRVTNEWADDMRALMNALAAKNGFSSQKWMSPFYNSVIAAVAGKADIEVRRTCRCTKPRRSWPKFIFRISSSESLLG